MRVMKDLYQYICDSDLREELRTAIVIEGANKGEKCLLSGQEIKWSFPDCSFLAGHLGEICRITGALTEQIEGQRVYCEKVGKQKKLVVCGGGHVSIPIIRIGKSLGFYVTVLEDRPTFADHAREAGADMVICDSFEQGMEQIEGGPDTYFVIVTRGHRYDKACLERAVSRPNAYVGMMGSRKRVGIVKEQLEDIGIQKALLEKVHTPIGLSIGAQTPEEIAVSVMAEIILVKNQERRAAVGYGEEMLKYLTGETDPDKKKVLATIVTRKGSGPREVGTHMLVEEDGTCIGTIGGGCGESAVMQKALLMMRQADQSAMLITVDMTGKEAEEAGMVCGGVSEVLLESV